MSGAGRVRPRYSAPILQTRYGGWAGLACWCRPRAWPALSHEAAGLPSIRRSGTPNLPSYILHFERRNGVEDHPHACVFSGDIHRFTAERLGEWPGRDIEPAVREDQPGRMEESFGGHAIPPSRSAVRSDRGEVEFHRQRPPSGIYVHRCPGHPIGGQQYERRDQTIQLDTALQRGLYRVKRLLNVDAQQVAGEGVFVVFDDVSSRGLTLRSGKPWKSCNRPRRGGIAPARHAGGRAIWRPG